MKRQYTTPESVCHIGPHKWDSLTPPERRGYVSPRESDYPSGDVGIRLCREHYLEAYAEVNPGAALPNI